MTDDSTAALLFGHAASDLPPRELADALRRAGLDAHYRESANRVGGEYVRIQGADDADCSLERDQPGEYLVHDAAGERASLEAMARALSAALAELRIPHRLEFYADGEAPDPILRLEWPPAS